MENLSPEHLQEEKAKLDQMRAELENKNKQMWAMSETVYKEKRRIEEQLSEMLTQKETLEQQKRENDEKVKMLWEQSKAIHIEKERINSLKQIIEQKHHEIVDSVNYAKRIQEAILPSLDIIYKSFPDSFVLFKPRDIVSGDFFWFEEKEGKSYIAAADCTGHGVPGAFMSVLGSNKLNEAISFAYDTSSLLEYVNVAMKRALKQSDDQSSTRDGMDIAVCSFNKEFSQLEYTGANRPLWIVREGLTEIEEIKATKTAIGGLTSDEQKFLKNKVALNKGDIVYIFSDGYADQFSSEDKKLMTRRFKEKLLEIRTLSMKEQMAFLDEFIEKWRGPIEQTDDILVIGVKV